jgi:indole-3-acetate monooxygenase
MTTPYIESRPALVGAARALTPQIRACAEEIERERRLPSAIVDAMVEAGLFKMLVPRTLGWHEANAQTLLEVVEEVAAADASAGWCVAIAAVCGVIAGFLEHDVAWEMFGSDPRACLVGSGAPAARVLDGPPNNAIAAEAGYRVTGRWAFASGCTHATWLLGVCPVFDGGAPQMDANGNPEIRTFFFPVADCQIFDTWHVTGLRGSGSHDFAVTDAWVPRARSLPLEPVPPQIDGQLFAFAPGFPYTPGQTAQWANTTQVAFGAVCLGIARGALEAFSELARIKTPQGDKQVLRDTPAVQDQVGRAEATLQAARAYLLATACELWDAAGETGTTTVEQQVGLHLATTHAAALATLVVDSVWSLAGTSSIVAGSAFDHRFRDLHTVTQNKGFSPQTYALAGKLFLGVDPRSA